MLNFIYNVLSEFLEPGSWMLIESDTDSAYLAIAAEAIDQIVREDKKQEWITIVKPKYFVFDDQPLTKRQPGLFKVERESRNFAGLSPKVGAATHLRRIPAFMSLFLQCYVLANPGGEEHPKCKGIQVKKSRNAEILTFEMYKKVLQEECVVAGHNLGFRYDPKLGGVVSYIQEKNALGPCSFKRIFDASGFSRPLEL